MKKVVTLVLALMMILSLSACGILDELTTVLEENNISDIISANDSETIFDIQVEEQEETDESEEESFVDDAEEEILSEEDLSAWQQTKTGKFYSQFDSGRMYMEYESEYEGTKMTIISATDGSRTYSESIMDGQSYGASIMDGEYMYSIDHTSKIVIKMSLQMDTQAFVNTVIEEEQVNPADIVTGTREIDGKTYETEEWSMEGGKSILCFDGDNLAYIIGEYEGIETSIKITKTSGDVDDKLFEIPEDYQLISY